MTKKHFEMIATEINLELTEIRKHNGNVSSILNLALSLAERFAQENPRFDAARFIEACGGYDKA